MNDKEYPVKLRRENIIETDNNRTLRASTTRDMEEGGRFKTTQASFARDTGSSPESYQRSKDTGYSKSRNK